MSIVLRRLALQPLKSNARNYNIPANYKKPTMDDLPMPQGSWLANHNAKQAKYNRHLALGIGFAIFTVITAKASGLFFFNWAAPPLPGKE